MTQIGHGGTATSTAYGRYEANTAATAARPLDSLRAAHGLSHSAPALPAATGQLTRSYHVREIDAGIFPPQ